MQHTWRCPSLEKAPTSQCTTALNCKAIAASLGDTEAALRACKRNLFPPSASAAVEADRDLKLWFGNNAPQSQLDLFPNNQPVKSLPYKEGKERLMEGAAPRERN